MLLIKNMKIRAKLFLGFFMLIAIVVFIAVFGMININTVNDSYVHMQNYPSARYDQLNQLLAELMDVRRIVTAMAFRIADHATLGELQTEAARVRAGMGRLMDAYQASLATDLMLDEEGRETRVEQAAILRSLMTQYMDEVVAGMFYAASEGIVGDAASRARIDIYLELGGDLYGDIEYLFDSLRDAAQEAVEEIYQDIQNATAATMVIMIVMTIAGVLLGLLTALAISTMVTKPIGLLSGALDDVAKGDLTKRLPEQGKDELAMASLSYNQSMNEFSKMISSIKSQSVTLSEIGSDLASNMTETASAMNEIAANIQSIKGRVINQSASVTQTNSTMDQVSNNINKLTDHVETQAAAVTQSSASVEEMLASIQSVTATLTKNADNVRELQDSADIGRTSLQEVASDIQEIARESEDLLEINSVMENIASQTNLLSMNAAIEAAHAGDSGRGFAVVADEIRKLAEGSSEQSKIIGGVLKKIKESIDKISRSTDNVMNRFETIDQKVKTVAEQEGNILNAMQEQSQGSKQILQASTQVNDITQQVKTGAVEMREGSREVIQEAKNLEKLTQEITDGMNEMAVGAEQVNRAVNTVNDLSGRTKENISVLAQSVSRFKV